MASHTDWPPLPWHGLDCAGLAEVPAAGTSPDDDIPPVPADGPIPAPPTPAIDGDALSDDPIPAPPTPAIDGDALSPAVLLDPLFEPGSIAFAPEFPPTSFTGDALIPV
jgi:hypothetical protein